MDEQLKSFSRRDKLIPLCELNRNDLDYVFETASVWPLKPHTLVSPEQESIFYLLEGNISLLSGGFVVESFTHTEHRGLLPLFDELKEEDSALFTSHGVILEIERALFEGLYSQRQARDRDLDEERLVSEEQQLYEQLQQAYKDEQLQLPVLPEAALKIRQLINEADVGSSEIIQIVQTDPVLSARLIKVVNSPLYGTWREIKTVRDAVRRLGLETTRNLSFGLSVSELFHARSSLVKQLIEQIYEESIQVSALAYVITQNQAKHLDPEQALLAGLLSNLGVIPILKYIDERPGVVSNVDSIKKSLNNLREPISRLLFDRWNFDAEFLSVVEHSNQWHRDTGQPADYVDIIIASKLLFMEKSGQLDESIVIHQLPIANKLDLYRIDDYGYDFLDQVEQEVADMQQTLRT
ncbi:MAG: HDOD domain-containing protein [Gammaproteobacteria bacterium]|nr:HDOD domain-containing protein [Gammaproteobacteria bacterium]